MGAGIHLVFGADDGPDGGVLTVGMGGHHRDVTAHDLHAGQGAGQGAVLFQNEAFGPHGGPDRLIGHAGCLQHIGIADVQALVFHPAQKHVDGRRA